MFFETVQAGLFWRGTIVDITTNDSENLVKRDSVIEEEGSG